jgi:CBS domain containing-hemolysin-like protein
MVPRIDMVAVDIETSLDEALATLIESGYSRIPVYDGSIDNIKGLLYAKDLLSLWRSGDPTAQKLIRDIIRPAYFVPENKRADDLLKEMQTRKIHMAMVVDEYGGTAGLVTIENLIEEIIGDIVDEHDVNEEAEYIRHGPQEYTVDGSIDLDDFNELLDVELPTEESDTLGGFIYTHLTGAA